MERYFVEMVLGLFLDTPTRDRSISLSLSLSRSHPPRRGQANARSPAARGLARAAPKAGLVVASSWKQRRDRRSTSKTPETAQTERDLRRLV